MKMKGVRTIPVRALLCSYKCLNTQGHSYYGVATRITQGHWKGAIRQLNHYHISFLVLKLSALISICTNLTKDLNTKMHFLFVTH